MKILSLILALAVLTGCTGTASLQRTLQDKKGSLLYVHDSEKVADKKSGSLSLNSFTVEDVLAPDTIVTRESTFVLPLIFFNIFKQEDQARLGYSQLENDYKQFFRESFIEEMKRSCTYMLRDGQGDLSLEVKIKKIEMSAPINQGGTFFFMIFFFGIVSHNSAGPVDVSVDADVQASKGGTIVLTKELSGKSRLNVPKVKGMNRNDYTTTMIEGVSMAAKDLNEKIVKEINKI